jgi:triacylglycerol lipase
MCSRLVIATLALWALVARAQVPSDDPGCVVLLHGLWRSELSMLGMAWTLERAGYTVANVTYPSLSYPIPVLARRAVKEGVAQCHARGHWRINFVTHSLGGILIRQYLAEQSIPGLRRVVMLGPPNQGSQLADYIHSLRFLRWLQPQAVTQLGTGEDSVPLQLGPVNFEVGVIAGTSDTLSIWPGAPVADSDGTVAVAETRVAGMTDFVALPTGHTFMMWNPDVQEQVLYFLQHGRFRGSG